MPNALKMKRRLTRRNHAVSKRARSPYASSGFEQLATQVLARFINLSLEDIDEGITQTLKIIGEFTNVDRAYVFLYSRNRIKMSNTHEWCKEGVLAQMDRIRDMPTKTFPWFENAMTQKKVVNIFQLDDLPAEAQTEKKEFAAQSIQSLICVPMIVGDSMIGFLGLDAVKTRREWPQGVVTLLKRVGEIFSSALERRASEEHFRKLNECFLSFEPNPIGNINRLVALCGELFEADCVFYSRINKETLCIVGKWGAPEDLIVVDKPQGHICYDVIQEAKDDITVIRHLAQTAYAQTDPSVKKYQWMTYLGQPVKFVDTFVGTLCILFKNDFIPTPRDKRLIGVASSAIGIEEKRQHGEEALRESEDRYRSLIETAPDTIFTITTENHTITSLNPAFEKITGWPCFQWLNRPFLDIVHPDDLALARDMYQKVLNKEQVSAIELRFLSSSGKYLIGEVVATPQIKNDRVMGVFGIARNITERKKSDEQLSILSKVVEQSPSVVMITDILGNIEYVNPKFTEITGYSRDEATGKNPRILKSGYTTAEEYQRLWKTIAAGKEWRGEFYNKKKNGEFYWGAAAILPIRTKEGTMTHFLGVEQDITERKKAEEVMREQSVAIKASMDGMAILNKYEKYVYLNDAHAKIYGYGSSDELIGQTWWILYDEDELKRFKDVVMPLFWKEGRWRGEAIGKKRDGSKFPQEISLTAIEGGGLVCVVRDITQRKAVEEALRKNETLLRTVFDAMPHWVFVKDRTSRMLLANKKMAEDYGVEPEELINVRTEETPLGKDDEKVFFIGVDQQVISTGEGVEIPEEKITKPNGEVRYLHTIKVPLKDTNGKVIGLVGVAQDITERKKAEQELDEYRKHLEELVEERTRELRHSERLAATGRLAASIAHEINNPLQGITTHLEIMHDQLPPDFTKMKNYDFVKSNIEKIRGIVTKLLDTYRGSDEGKTEVNINDTIKKVVFLVEHQLTRQGIHLKLHLAKNLPLIPGWKQQLYQVFLNLILNAQDSIKNKGDVVITTSLNNGMVTVAIADTGEGIHPRDMDHLFEPFFTTKAESGTGLGLFVSQGIIKEHHGIIKVKSEFAKGSTFTVFLPTHQPVFKKTNS